MLVGYNDDRILEIPPKVTRVRLYEDWELVIGNHQDRSANRLVAYKIDPEENNIEIVLILEKTLKMDEKPNPYYLYTIIRTYGIFNELTSSNKSIIKFVNGEIPFYVDREIVYNRKHENVCPITEELVSLLLNSKRYRISEERCLFWIPGTILSLYIDDSMITFRASSLDLPYSIVTDNVMLNHIEVDDEVINYLNHIPTIEEARRYLSEELMLEKTT
jgi:hypothetical protein